MRWFKNQKIEKQKKFETAKPFKFDKETHDFWSKNILPTDIQHRKRIDDNKWKDLLSSVNWIYYRSFFYKNIYNFHKQKILKNKFMMTSLGLGLGFCRLKVKLHFGKCILSSIVHIQVPCAPSFYNLTWILCLWIRLVNATFQA